MHFPHEHRGSYFTTYREGDWKLIYYYHPENPAHPEAVLYNLRHDREERHDLSARYPAKRRQLLRRMCRQLQREGALYPVDKQGNELRPDPEL